MSHKYLFDYISSLKEEAKENIYVEHFHSSIHILVEWNVFGQIQDYKEYNEEGMLITHICRQHFSANPLNFQLFKWWGNGQLKSLKELNEAGQLDGGYFSWHRNGKVRFNSQYQCDQILGEYNEWWENGQLKTVEFFQNGNIHGFCQYNNEDGTLNHQKLYQQNQLILQW